LNTAILIVFALVYVGMIFGRWPGLALDRTGIALLGAIAMLALGAVGTREAWDAIDVPTIALLFGMMVLSANLRVSGFYARVTSQIAALDVTPPKLLAILIGVAAVLSSVLTNDVVCLAMAPLLVEGCQRRGLAPLPFLLGLACASNVGSAATLIGNPQNMLIGQYLHLDFGRYVLDAIVPTLLGLVATWAVIAWITRGRWTAPRRDSGTSEVAYDALSTWRALVVTAIVVAAFLLSPWPREVIALAAAGFLLVSRRTRSRDMLALVDWQLLVLFVGLFIVNHALAHSGLLERGLEIARGHGVDPSEPKTMFVGIVALSNLVSNVPATMLLLPTATHPLAGPVMAIASTFAGNLLLVGSIANIIVADQASAHGVKMGWSEHAKVGVPVTLVTLAIAAAWLALRA